MTSNLTAAANTHLSTAQFDQVTDFYGNADSLAGSMLHISKLVQGMGPTDRSSNFFIAQKQLMESQSKEGADIREAINDEIVDGLEHVRMKEQIAYTKQRVQSLLEVSSDEQKETSAQDSQDLVLKNQETHKHLQSVVKQLRNDAREFLGVQDASVPLTQIFRRLSKDKLYLKKRDTKFVDKELTDKQTLQQEL